MTNTTDKHLEQINRGFNRLQFTPELESDFRLHLVTEHRRAARICAMMGMIIWIIFIGYDFIRIGMLPEGSTQDPLVQLWLSIRFTVLGTWIYANYRVRSSTRPYRNLVFLAYLSCSIGSAICAAIIGIKGLPNAHHFEAIVTMAAFLPFGLTFYQAFAMAVIACSFSIAAYGFAHYQEGIAAALRFSIPLICAVPVGGVGGYLREYAEREQFLYRNIFRNQATQDPLTGIANRRLFEQHSQEQLRHADRLRKYVVVAMADIDFFKQYNDTYGHDAGDDAIRMTSQKLRHHITRPNDMVARMGGEEFGIFLYDISLSDAHKLLQRVLDDIRATAFDHQASPIGVLTLSIGLARGSKEDLKDLFRRADAALYRAKSSGRNQLAVDGVEANHNQPNLNAKTGR